MCEDHPNTHFAFKYYTSDLEGIGWESGEVGQNLAKCSDVILDELPKFYNIEYNISKHMLSDLEKMNNFSPHQS